MPPSDTTTVAGDELAEAAQASGCRVLSRSTFDDGATKWPVLDLECADNANAIRYLNHAATIDTQAPDVRDLALRLRRAHFAPEAFGRAVQAFVQAAVRFVREARETFQHTLYTLRRGAGDCDDHARVVAALTRGAGLRAQIVGVANKEGRTTHVAPLVFDGSNWRWAETTIAARFGEHPRDAARRLGVKPFVPHGAC
jgi:transglutaminase-like putative cysteine protease